MKQNLVKELIIVCVSTLCILVMLRINTVDKNEYVEKNERIKALIMKSDDKYIGVVSNEIVGNDAISMVKDIYINSANISDIKDITLYNEILYEDTTCDKSEILTEEGVVNKIIEYNNSHDDSIVSFIVDKGNSDKVAFRPLSRGESELYREVFLHSSITTPIKGVLTSTFGEQRNGYNHKGIDLAAESGTSIKAALDGKVSFAGVANGYGNVVIIDHGGKLQTVYAHCSKLNVVTGETVFRSQNIAKVGSTGDSTGPHLHFEIRVDGMVVNPLAYSGGTEY
ncbi:MAG: M23 family metallopeptidase [Clostridium sp.]